jgi:hypothetical protein
MLGADPTSTASSFYDPLFGHLRGAAQVMEMWSAIMPKANPFQISPTVQGPAIDLGNGAWQVHGRRQGRELRRALVHRAPGSRAHAVAERAAS